METSTAYKKQAIDDVAAIKKAFNKQNELFSTRNDEENHVMQMDEEREIVEKKNVYKNSIYKITGAVTIEVIAGYLGINLALEKFLVLVDLPMWLKMVLVALVSFTCVLASTYTITSILKIRERQTNYREPAVLIPLCFIPLFIMPIFSITHIISSSGYVWYLQGLLCIIFVSLAVFMCVLAYTGAKDFVYSKGRRAQKIYSEYYRRLDNIADIDRKAARERSIILDRMTNRAAVLTNGDLEKVINAFPLEHKIILRYKFLGEPLVDPNSHSVFLDDQYPFIKWWLAL